MWNEDRSTRLETGSGSAGRRHRALLAIDVLGGLVSATVARGEPAFLASLAAEVVGITTFRIDVRSRGAQARDALGPWASPGSRDTSSWASTQSLNPRMCRSIGT